MKYLPGQTLRFTYRFHTGALPGETGDDFKEVMVLHPTWQGKLHGIDLKRLTAAERETLSAIFDPDQKEKQHRFPLVNDILRRMDPISDIKNPVSFYSKFVKVFLRNKDAYRTYYPGHMLNVTIAEQTKVAGTVTNPTPLFHKVESKATTQQQQQVKPIQQTQVSRMDLLKQRVQARNDANAGKVQRPKIQRPIRPK